MQDAPGRLRLVTGYARMPARTGGPKGDDTTRARVKRLYERRKREGWQPYAGWLRPETAALVSELKRPGEALHDLIDRALRTLANLERGQANDAVSPVQRKASILARLLAWEAEGLTHQAMANHFNSEGVPTLTGRGRWHGGTIGKLLKQAAD